MLFTQLAEQCANLVNAEADREKCMHFTYMCVCVLWNWGYSSHSIKYTYTNSFLLTYSLRCRELFFCEMRMKVEKRQNENFIVVLFDPYLLLYRLQLTTYAAARFQASLNTWRHSVLHKCEIQAHTHIYDKIYTLCVCS